MDDMNAERLREFMIMGDRAARLWRLPWQKFYGALSEGVYPLAEQRAHLSAIRDSAAHDYLYECLTILDTKAAALLQYDSIVFAAATLAISLFHKHLALGPGLIVASLILSGLSSISCLQVIWVYWTLTADFAQPADEFLELMRVRNRRTVLYRLAWMLAQLAILLLMAGIILTEI